MKRMPPTGPTGSVTLIAFVLLWLVAPAQARPSHKLPSRKTCTGGTLWAPLDGESKARGFANLNPQTFTMSTGEALAITRSPSVNSSAGDYTFTAGAPLFASPVDTKTSQTQSVPPDSPRWQLEGQAKPTEYQGRKCLYLDGGAAILKDLEMRDGVIDVDVATPANRGFFGIDFRLADEGANGERVYLRQHKSGAPDAMQYTPVLNTGANWQIYNGPGFTAAVDIPRDAWFHMRLEVAGAQAKWYVKDMDKPALVMNDLKSGVQKGLIALYVLTGATYYTNFEFRETPAAPWERHNPPMPPDTLIKWSLSPSYDALARNLERPLSASERDSIKWQEVEAEAPGFVVVYRYREAPHLRVTFANDFAKRLEPQPGAKVVYAKTTIVSDRDQVKKLYIGYSDDVSVFLNGRILYRGRSAQNFRDPAFLGIVNPENDAVYVQLRKGSNELVLAVSELGGGWGFICRLVDPES